LLASVSGRSRRREHCQRAEWEHIGGGIQPRQAQL